MYKKQLDSYSKGLNCNYQSENKRVCDNLYKIYFRESEADLYYFIFKECLSKLSLILFDNCGWTHGWERQK